MTDQAPTPEGRARTHAVGTAWQGALRVRGDRPAVLLGWHATSPWAGNLVLHDWATAAAKLFSAGSQAYRISSMYVEFENAADPDADVVPPTYGRGPGEGVAYYDSLADSVDRDYLRIPILASTVSSSDAELYPGGNLVSFFAQTSGVAGVHGKAFSDVAGSKVFGAALVSTPEQGDPTRDVVVSRIYFAANRQRAKSPTGQVGVEWELKFK